MNCEQNINEFSILAALGWTIAGGSIGGLLDFFNRFKINPESSIIRFQGASVGIGQCFSLAFMNTSLGAGGAIAVQFAMLGIGKFQHCQTTESILFLFSLSVVAGFGGRKFLSLLSNRLEEQLGEQDQKIKEVKAVAGEAKADAEEAKIEAEEAKVEAEEGMIVSSAIATLGSNSTVSERSDMIMKLERAVGQDPLDRRLVILLGRLYRKHGDYIGGAGVLSDFINRKKRIGALDVDYADALYNRSCYRVLQHNVGGADNENLIDIAIEDLADSIKILPDNVDDAISDPDFESIWDLEAFKNTTGQN
jgi:hypothetical protein